MGAGIPSLYGRGLRCSARPLLHDERSISPAIRTLALRPVRWALIAIPKVAHAMKSRALRLLPAHATPRELLGGDQHLLLMVTVGDGP